MKTPTDYRKMVYKQYRNVVNNEIKKAKYEYYKVKFNNDKGNIKATWKTINEALGTKSRNKNCVDTINVNGAIITNKNYMSDIFNDYFVNIGFNLTNNVQYNSEYNQQLNVNERSAYFTPISCKEIIDVVCDFKNGTSAGCDGIDVSVVKKIIHLICSPLSSIFNSLYVTWYFS